MDEARSGLDKIYAFLERAEEKIGLISDQDVETGDCWQRFSEAMDDDFNSARGIGILFDTVRSTNRLLDQHQDNLSQKIKKTIQSNRSDILKIGNVLGILVEPPKVYFDKKRFQGLEQKSIDPAVIDKMVKEREDARKTKDWEKADQIRKQLDDMNIIIEDRPDGTIWKINN
jgi:cysteinyl-tRNA synthetase